MIYNLAVYFMMVSAAGLLFSVLHQPSTGGPPENTQPPSLILKPSPLFSRCSFCIILFVHRGKHSVESNLCCLLVCPQLLGFVYACYVVSAITEEEDSCESLNHTLTHTHTHS